MEERIDGELGEKGIDKSDSCVFLVLVFGKFLGFLLTSPHNALSS